MLAAERRGFALLLVVAVLLAAGALGLLAATLAAERVRLVRARAEQLRARLAAASIAADGLRAWDRTLVAGLQPGVETPLIVGPFGRATIERLAPTGLLVRGFGSVPIGAAAVDSARTAVALLVSAVDLAELAAAFDAALTIENDAGAVLVGAGAIDGSLRLDSTAVLELDGASPPDPPLDGPLPRLPLSPESMAAAWPAGADAPPLMFGDSLALAETRGGLILVLGTLVLRAGSRLEGPVLVSGRLIIEAGAEVDGAVRLVPGARLRVEGRLVADPGAVLAALDTSSVLDRPYRLGARLWLPIY